MTAAIQPFYTRTGYCVNVCDGPILLRANCVMLELPQADTGHGRSGLDSLVFRRRSTAIRSSEYPDVTNVHAPLSVRRACLVYADIKGVYLSLDAHTSLGLLQLQQRRPAADVKTTSAIHG